MDIINPFAQAIVTDAWQAPQSDVPMIHAGVFELCCEVLEQVRRSGGSRSVLLHGLPGSGKTHLLARVRTNLNGVQNDLAATVPVPLPPNVLFIAVRLRAGARMLCRHLRRTLAADLFRPTRLGMSQLEQLLLYRFAQFLKDRKKAQKSWIDLRQPQKPWPWWLFKKTDEVGRAKQEIEAMIERLDEQAALGRNLSAILRHLALGRHRRNVRDWLHDGVLPDGVMRDLGLMPPPEDEDPEEQALDMVCAVSRLADSSTPLVLCFDQVEALQTSPDDVEGLYAFGRMVSSLRDKTRNTLLLSCVQTAFLDKLDEIIRGADMDRLAEKAGLLKPLSVEEAQRLIPVRLDSAPAVAKMRKGQANKLWPLKPNRIAEFMQGNPACTPRQLISFCEDEFEKWRHGQAQPATSLEEFLALQYTLEYGQALRSSHPHRMDETLAHGLPLLLALLGRGKQVVDAGHKYADLIFEADAGRLYISFCNQAGNPLTARLAKLREAVEQGRIANLVVVRDSRLAISQHAKKAQEHLDALTQREVTLLRPSAEGLAAIEAFRSLLSDAKAGDLAKRGEGIGPGAVEEWFKAHLPSSVADFAEGLTPERRLSGREAIYDELLELVQQERIVRLDEAAERLHRDAETIAACAAGHLDQFGILQGPPLVIFEKVAAAESAA